LVLSNGFKVREVRCRSENGHRTSIVTTRRDLPVLEVADRMFSRWRQENFFRYMRHEFDLDHLPTLAVEAADPWRRVPSPERKALKKEVEAVAHELANLVGPFLGPHHNDEARSFLRQVFQLPADLVPDPEAGTLTVRLHSMANWRSNRAVAGLCEILNSYEACCPGTQLRLVLEPPPSE
jgi:hypothetical protein